MNLKFILNTNSVFILFYCNLLYHPIICQLFY